LFDDSPPAGQAGESIAPAEDLVTADLVTGEELGVLESLLERARHAVIGRRAMSDDIQPGDVVQLCPGADPDWQTSLLLVCRIRDDGGISGQILRPHRGGFRECWYTYRPPLVVRIGRMPFPEPPLSVRSTGYWPPCPNCGGPLGIQGEGRKPPDSEKQKRGKRAAG